jgi:hypothetical protein
MMRGVCSVVCDPRMTEAKAMRPMRRRGALKGNHAALSPSHRNLEANAGIREVRCGPVRMAFFSAKNSASRNLLFFQACRALSQVPLLETVSFVAWEWIRAPLTQRVRRGLFLVFISTISRACAFALKCALAWNIEASHNGQRGQEIAISTIERLWSMTIASLTLIIPSISSIDERFTQWRTLGWPYDFRSPYHCGVV